MARNGWALNNSAAVALVAATAKTVLQAKAVNTILVVQGLEVTFDGNSNTATPVIVALMLQSTAGTMTNRAPVKTKDTSTALNVTGQENATAEPTAGNVIKKFHIHPQAGVVYPLTLPDGEVEVPAGTWIGVQVTAPANVNCLANLYGEE